VLRHVLALTLAVPAVALTTAGLTPASAATVPTCHGVAATVVGTAGDDTLVGTDAADVIVGLGGNDHLRGLRGNDLLCGGLGADELVGGRGDDALHGGLDVHRHLGHGQVVVRGDLLDGGPGDDLLDAQADYGRRAMVRRPDTVTYRSSPGPVGVDLRAGTGRGDGRDTIVRTDRLQVVGSPFDDQLAGSSRPDVLLGRAGDDRLAGRGGSDALIDTAGDDLLSGGPGSDIELSNRGTDTLTGERGRDILLGVSRRPTTVKAGRGSDYVFAALASKANGVLDGGPGHNGLTLDTPFPDDYDTTVDRAAGTAVAQSGTTSATTSFDNFSDFTLSGFGTWTYVGTDAPDIVQVSGGSLNASTLGGDDVMVGDQGDDTLDGGNGTDEAWGGKGANTCLNDEQGECNGYPQYRSAAGRVLSSSQDAGFARGLPQVRRALARYAPDLLR
jgi:Ca2+-binding RTX toxin-like protein